MKLIDVARECLPGQQIRIAEFDQSIPRVERIFSKALTDAQLIAYQEKWVMDKELSDDGKVILCTIIDEREFLHLVKCLFDWL